jgi:hypothetical protein
VTISHGQLSASESNTLESETKITKVTADEGTATTLTITINFPASSGSSTGFVWITSFQVSTDVVTCQNQQG